LRLGRFESEPFSARSQSHSTTIEYNLKTQITDAIAEKTAKKLGVSYKNSNASLALEEYLNQNYSNALAVEQAIAEIGRAK
jgi:hypothetical protein